MLKIAVISILLLIAFLYSRKGRAPCTNQPEKKEGESWIGFPDLTAIRLKKYVAYVLYFWYLSAL